MQVVFKNGDTLHASLWMHFDRFGASLSLNFGLRAADIRSATLILTAWIDNKRFTVTPTA